MNELTKEEKKELRKQEWQEQLKKEEKQKKFRKIFTWLALPFVLIGTFWLITVVTTPQNNTPTTDQSIKIAPVSEKEITLGSQNAKVTIVEYADFQCPACKGFHDITKKLQTDYNGKIRFVYRFFPLTAIHKNAYISAQAAYAAHKQGKFWEMHDLLFDNQEKWATLANPTETFIDYAEMLKLDIDVFKKDLQDKKTKEIVQNSEKQAQTEGINHTPTIFINGKELANISTYEGIKDIINKELAKK